MYIPYNFVINAHVDSLRLHVNIRKKSHFSLDKQLENQINIFKVSLSGDDQ